MSHDSNTPHLLFFFAMGKDIHQFYHLENHLLNQIIFLKDGLSSSSELHCLSCILICISCKGNTEWQKKNRISYMHEKNVFSLYLNPPQQASKGHCGET